MAGHSRAQAERICEERVAWAARSRLSERLKTTDDGGLETFLVVMETSKGQVSLASKWHILVFHMARTAAAAPPCSCLHHLHRVRFLMHRISLVPLPSAPFTDSSAILAPPPRPPLPRRSSQTLPRPAPAATRRPTLAVVNLSATLEHSSPCPRPTTLPRSLHRRTRTVSPHGGAP